jgi:hypothetical protein
MMGTLKELSSSENIQVVTFMENHIVKLAKLHSFNAIVTTNTNQLTQQIDESLLGYQTLNEFQINQFVDKFGNRPFQKAKDSQKTTTMWKDVVDE